MKKYLLFLLSFFFVTASQSTSQKWKDVDRAPTSMANYSKTDDEYTQELLRAINQSLQNPTASMAEPEQAIDDLLHQILNRSAFGYVLLKRFDMQLNKVVRSGKIVDMSRQRSYLRLQLYRPMMELLEERFISVYVHLWQINLGFISFANQPLVQERSQELISGIHARLDEISRDARVLGILRLQNDLTMILEDIDNDVADWAMGNTSRKQIQMHRKLQKNLSMVLKQLSEREKQAVASSEFIERMGGIRDEELLREIQTVKSIPAGDRAFQNINGSGFPKGKWVLTFDDGPHKQHTRAIAKVLKQHGVKSEFFWLSKNVKAYNGIAKEIYDAGHRISSHSIDHANLPKLGTSQLRNQVSGSRDAIQAVLQNQGASSYRMKYFRAPYGAGVMPPKSQKVIDAISGAGLTHVAWNVDSLDWQDKNSKSVVDRVIKQMKAQGRGVILFHDIQAPTAQTVSLLLNSKYVSDSKIKFSQL